MKANFHTHTFFCDGRSTAEEMVLRAIELDFRALGFSGHSYVAFDKESCMSPSAQVQYMAEIERLRRIYGDRIEIYCGTEQDYYSGRVSDEYEYAIGSVHYVCKDGYYCPVDLSRDITEEIITRMYGGDRYAYAEDYYLNVGNVAEVTGAAIIGHFDLIRKFDDDGSMFTFDEPRYKAVVIGAIDKLCGNDVVFEINTGAIASGYRTAPYPEQRILEELRDRDVRIMINTDCHRSDRLDCGYEIAVVAAKRAGFTHQTTIAEGIFVEERLD